jgi:hypothetical protein
MPRITALNPSDAPAQAQPMLAAVKAKLGMVPNLFKTFAHSPAVLQFYLSKLRWSPRARTNATIAHRPTR